mmetsp:Transcript_43650/g.102978  ORF Transcript_43650/g.102978 Transcript_43650/m.102978 type:complete len:168 (-) Transcript_43650:243-746(-)
MMRSWRHVVWRPLHVLPRCLDIRKLGDTPSPVDWALQLDNVPPLHRIEIRARAALRQRRRITAQVFETAAPHGLVDPMERMNLQDADPLLEALTLFRAVFPSMVAARRFCKDLREIPKLCIRRRVEEMEQTDEVGVETAVALYINWWAGSDWKQARHQTSGGRVEAS